MESNEKPLQVSDFVPSKTYDVHEQAASSVHTETSVLSKRVSIATTPSQINTENCELAQTSTCSTTNWTGVEKDSRGAWLVCLAAFTIQVFVTGQLHVYGVFFAAILDDLKCSKGAGAWVGSMAYGLTMLLAPLSSTIINNYGNHVSVFIGIIIVEISLISSSYASSIEVLFFTFSVIFGFGNALAYTPTMTIAGDYFDKYFTVAIGLSVAGTSIGTVVLSPLSQVLIDNFGWRGAMRVLSIFSLSGLWSAYIFMPKGKRPRNALRDIKKSPARRLVKDLQMWKNRVFVLWVSGITLAMFGYYIPYVHLVSHCIDLGISADKGALLLMVLGGSTAIGRVVFGKVVDMGWMDRLHMHQLSLIVTGTGAMILPCIHVYWGLMLYVVLAGFVDGCMVVLLPVLTTNLMGAENKVTAWGYLTGVSAITFTLGPPTAGWLYDATGSYNLAFHLAGVPIILGGCILFLIPWAQRTANSTNAMTAAQSYAEMDAPFQVISEDEMSIIASHSDHTAYCPSSPELEDEVTVFSQEVKTPTSVMIEFSPTDMATSSNTVKNTLQGAAQILSDAGMVSIQPETPTSSLSRTSATSLGSIVRQRPRPSGSQLNSPAYPLSNLMSPQLSQMGDLDIEVDDLMNIQVYSPDTTNCMLQDALQEIAESPLSGAQSLTQARSRTMSTGLSLCAAGPRLRTISCNEAQPQLPSSPLSGLDIMFQNSTTPNLASSPLDDSFVHVAPGFALSSGSPTLAGHTTVNSLTPQTVERLSSSDPESQQPRNITSDELIFGVPSIH